MRYLKIFLILINFIAILIIFNCQQPGSRINPTNATTAFTYSETGSGVTITAYKGTSTEVIIPSTIDNKPVISIGANAFYNCSDVTSITIPSTVTSIGTDAFSYTGLTSITVDPANPNFITLLGVLFDRGITKLYKAPRGLSGSYSVPSTVTSIGNYAFQYCTYLTGITFLNPAIVTSIGNGAFYGCTGLTPSITIPSNVNSIGVNTFYGCTGLTSITIPSGPTGVTYIGDYSFYNCTGLTSITIPSNVTYIGTYAFYNCINITSSITIPATVTSIGDYAFYSCAKLTSVSNLSNVTSIGNFVFYGCTGLHSITIPSTVTSIGTYAFCNCSNSSLTSISIPVNVTSIGDYSFYNCTGLTSITIPSNVATIGYAVFYGCINAGPIITIPASVTSIGDYTFYGCTDLTTLTVNATTPPVLGGGNVLVNTGIIIGPPPIGTISVPSASLAQYQAAATWSAYAGNMTVH